MGKTTKNNLNIGVYGLGMGANILTLNSEPSGELRVRSICTRSEEKLRHFQKLYNIEHAFTDYEKMLDDPDIDIVAVYTPDALHADHCVKALSRGKHVVCTKPMATSNEEAREIVEAVKKSGKKFIVAQTARFVKQYEHVKSFTDSGDIGNILACRSQYIHDISPYLSLTPWRLEMPQDFMYGGGLHPIDLLRWFAGDVEEVYSYSQKSGRSPGYRHDDNFMILLKFTSGCIGTVAVLCGVVHPPVPIISVDLFGDKGSINAVYSEGEPGYLKLVAGKLSDAPVQEINYPAETGVTYQHGESERRIFRYFAECIIKNTRPDPDEIEGAKGVAVGAAAWKSIRTGKPVKVDLDF
jgi:predicted dehydrogenase